MHSLITGVQEFMMQINTKLDRLLPDRSMPETHSPILYRPVLNYYQDSLNEVSVHTNNINSHNRKSTRNHSSTSYPTIYSGVGLEGESSSPPAHVPPPTPNTAMPEHRVENTSSAPAPTNSDANTQSAQHAAATQNSFLPRLLRLPRRSREALHFKQRSVTVPGLDALLWEQLRVGRTVDEPEQFLNYSAEECALGG
ncbi:hypothetical protein EST38_g12872 [Candolleomyces aberdarensis]|uniref:Uncharacterized protein n=1 Tax=Candolleomyces aberdarensis TaxID=2316362 RepID=A0A4Q2D3N5_9AGAR|nr:hypothetical protein EST38_g12872 [Candolleomyces aberdarensis]